MNLYLILHKVRGEPAFDIAEKVQIGKEEGWIIPTSGHRAYPVLVEQFNGWDNYDREMFATVPDHYQTTKAPPPPKLNVRALLAGLRPTLNFKRRI
jgi:hypothetical protein